MNIFVLDNNPVKAAEYHCDKHVVKMILETAQILSTVQWELGYEAPYKPTHRHHPCTVWAGMHIHNYMWACKLGMALCKEYTYRYGKIHKTTAVLQWLMDNPPENLIAVSRGLYPDNFALAMPDEYKTNMPVESYRSYYRNEKRDFLKYTKRSVPDWLSDHQFTLKLN